MTDASALLGIGLAIATGTASPGPSFLMVTRLAAAEGRWQALQAACGMAIAALVFAGAALLGMTGLLHAVPPVYVALKVVGGAYLVYLGVRIWRSASTSGQDNGQVSHGPTRRIPFWLQGFATQFSNPKTAVVFASVFATFLPAAPTWQFGAALLSMIFAIQVSWYGFVAIAMSAEAPRGTYLRFKPRIDRVTGGVLVILGLRLLSSVR